MGVYLFTAFRVAGGRLEKFYLPLFRSARFVYLHNPQLQMALSDDLCTGGTAAAQILASCRLLPAVLTHLS